MAYSDVLVLDIETDSTNTEKANLRYFGAYSYKDSKHHLISCAEKDKIVKLLNSHKVFCGFNLKKFDLPILERVLGLEFKYKIVIDLYEISAPNQAGSKRRTNKNRLAQMGVKVSNYKLRTIAEKLKFKVGLKGDIDYSIFKKEEWTKSEITEIEKYLKQDIDITKALFEWYDEQFEPLKIIMTPEDRRKFRYLTSSIAVLGYRVICNKAGLEVEWQGGHRPKVRELYNSNIILLGTPMAPTPQKPPCHPAPQDSANIKENRK